MIFNNSFLNGTVTCNERKAVDLDALNLLASGAVEELCPCTYKNEKGHHHFVYHTTGLVPFARLQASLTFDDMVLMLESALRLVGQMSGARLILDHVKISKEYLFKNGNAFQFVYIPLIGKPHLTVKEFILKLLSVIHSKDARVVHLTKELRKIKEDAQVMAYLGQFLTSFRSSMMYAPQNGFAEQDDGGATTLLNASAMTPMDEGETTVLSQASYEEMSPESARLTAYFQDESAEYETTVLTSQPVVEQPISLSTLDCPYSLYLIRNINGERIPIDVTPFTIGKDGANMDYVLDNASVSRYHATVIYENGIYYITDNQSTNGTMIEGVRLQPHEKAELGSGYMITLGTESFQAHIERR